MTPAVTAMHMVQTIVFRESSSQLTPSTGINAPMPNIIPVIIPWLVQTTNSRMAPAAAPMTLAAVTARTHC